MPCLQLEIQMLHTQDSLDQCPMPIKILALRGIQMNWSALIGNNQFWSVLINAAIFISIDWHWAVIGQWAMSPAYSGQRKYVRGQGSNPSHKLVISSSFDGVLFGEDLTNVMVILLRASGGGVSNRTLDPFY